jgi:hypothetical protein
MPGNPLTDPNWAPDLADTVERVVGAVRDKTTAKVVTLVRAVVFGLTIAVAGVVALILLVIVGLRLLQRVLTIFGWIEPNSSVGISYLVLGGIFGLGGMFMMRKRRAKEHS